MDWNDNLVENDKVVDYPKLLVLNKALNSLFLFYLVPSQVNIVTKYWFQ